MDSTGDDGDKVGISSKKQGYRTTVSVPLDIEVLQEIDWLCSNRNPDRRHTKRTEAIRMFIEIGIFVTKNKEEISSGKFVQGVNMMAEREALMDWVHGLSTAQRRAVSEILRQRERQVALGGPGSRWVG